MSKQFSMVFICFLSLINTAYSDFVAFRKLTHPKTGNIVYLLYDLHATIDFDSESTKLKVDKLNTLAKETYKKTLGREEFIKTAEETFPEIRKNFKNLTKQHNDLIEIIKKYGISLIDEDWPNLPTSKTYVVGFLAPMGKLEPLTTYIDKHVGNLRSPKNFPYRDNVTPMTGISNALLEEFTIQKITQIKGINAYFYNADSRILNPNLSSNDKETLEVDRLTLEALDTLFTNFKQKKVIIAEGANHITAIAHKLITDKGYVADELIISDALKKQRKNNSIIETELKGFENNKKSDIELTDEAIYYLVDQPIDLKAIFEKESKKEENRPSLDIEAMKRRSDLIGKASKLLKRADALKPQEKTEIISLRNNMRLFLKSIKDKKNDLGLSPENYTIFMEKLTTLEKEISKKEVTPKNQIDQFAKALRSI